VSALLRLGRGLPLPFGSTPCCAPRLRFASPRSRASASLRLYAVLRTSSPLCFASVAGLRFPSASRRAAHLVFALLRLGRGLPPYIRTRQQTDEQTRRLLFGADARLDAYAQKKHKLILSGMYCNLHVKDSLCLPNSNTLSCIFNFL